MSQLGLFEERPRTDTLAAARAWLAEQFDAGASCPCCGRFVKIYRRKLSSGMARALICLHRSTVGDEWVDVTACLMRWCISAANSNAALLRYWDLIEAKEGEREDGSRRVGIYRVTERGRAFVRGEVDVPRHVYLLCGEPFERPDGETTTIAQALGDRFSYAELMERAAP